MFRRLSSSESLALGVGRVVSSVDVSDDTVTVNFEDGAFIYLYHEQDCCESVYVESVIGDVADLVGEVLLVSEEVSDEGPYIRAESYTWTFYKFRSRKGEIVVRFLGSSNGYYSESVNVRFGSSTAPVSGSIQ